MEISKKEVCHGDSTLTTVPEQKGTWPPRRYDINVRMTYIVTRLDFSRDTTSNERLKN